ncbi:MAG: DNA polymerase III subunit delta, partial [Planctomycetota bacterium]
MAGGRRGAKGKKGGAARPPDATTFLRGFRDHQPSPVYCLTGDEPFFRDRIVKALRFKLLGREAPASAVHTVSAKRQAGEAPIDPAGLLDELRTGSLFEAIRIVRVQDAKALFDKGAEALIGYCAKPAGGVHLILEAESLDGRTKLGKALAAKAVVIDCRRPFDHPPPWAHDAAPWDHPLAAWLVGEGRIFGLTFDKELAHTITQRVGNEPGLLSRECERLAAVIGGTRQAPKPLTRHDLDTLVPDTRGEDLFRLGDAVTRRDRAEALKITDALFRDGVPERSGGRTRDATAVAIRIAGWLHRTLREIWITRTLIARRAGSAEIARALGKKPMFAEAL